ncbi:unnamed protein product, partial [Rotaria magnacalcarata]
MSDIGAEKTQNAILTDKSINVTRRPTLVLLVSKVVCVVLAANVDDCVVQLGLDAKEYCR